MNFRKESLRQLITFLIIIFIVTTVVYIVMFNGAQDNIYAVLVMMWTPGITAIITSLIHKNKIRDFGWKPGKIKYLSYAYVLPFIISLIAYGLVWYIGIAEFTTKEVINYKWAKMLGFSLPVPFIIGALSKMSLGFLFTCFFVLGEEIGWSGFFTPKLLELFSVPVTSLIVGVFWAVWHYPAIIGNLYGSGTPLWIALPGFTFVLIGYSFIRTILVFKSKSLWTGVILHSSGNVILMGMFYEMTVHQGYSAYIVSETGIFTGIVCITVSLLFVKFLINNK